MKSWLTYLLICMSTMGAWWIVTSITHDGLIDVAVIFAVWACWLKVDDVHSR